MHIFWHGQYTVKLQTADTVVVIDPYAPSVGLSPFRSRADIVALTNPHDAAMSHVAGVQGEPLLMTTPGEYSARGMALHARGWFDGQGQERSLHRYTMEGLTLLHVGAMNRDLTNEELAELEKTNIDVLFLPVGGGGGLTTKQALSLMTTIEPRIVIPIHFHLPGLKEKLDPVDVFAKEVGLSPKSAEKKVILKAKKLPQEDVQTILLMP